MNHKRQTTLLCLTALLLSHTQSSAIEVPLKRNVQELPIKGIVLLGPNAVEPSTQELKAIQGVKIIDLQVPGSRTEMENYLLEFMKINPLSMDSVKHLQMKIKEFYTDKSHPFVLIQIPEQDVTAGVLQFRIIESRIGNVAIEGNKWHSTRLLKQFLGIKPGQPLNQRKLMQNLNFINQDPFLQADLVYMKGAYDYTTDVILSVKERDVINFYAGVDNTGVETVGRNRWFMGFNWGNAFGLGHSFATQYTASFNRHQFQGITVQYIAPLTWHHILNVYGGYTVVNPELNIPTATNHGWSAQASLRYQIPLPLSPSLQHNVIIGGDFKRTNNTFEFTEFFPRAGQNVNLTQATVEYKGSYGTSSYQLDFDGSLFWSPGAWIANQSNADYQVLRKGGNHSWIYFRGAFSYLQNLPAHWTFYLLSRGQVASQNLLPSEQYGIGGYDTVRGYEQRTLNKDSAFLTTLEVRSPKIGVIKDKNARNPDALQFLAFLDYGWGTDHNAEVPGFKTNYLLGVGPGIRYAYSTYLTMRFDVGAKLHKKHFRGGSAMVHFSVIGSF